MSKVLALVPARGGSQGLPRKNLQEVAGRSLIARAVHAAARVPRVDVVVVSSDDEEILVEGRRAGAEASPRPAALAADDTPTIDVILWELVHWPDVDTVVLLQPTSPLRTEIDVQACLNAYDGEHPVVTVSPASHPADWTFRRLTDGSLEPLLGWETIAHRRQMALQSYVLNGAVYVASRQHLLEQRSFVGPTTRAVVMPPERSVDIDSEFDLVLARLLASRGTS